MKKANKGLEGQTKAKKPLSNLSSGLIMAPDRKALNSCVSTPRNTHKAGITSLSLFVHICPLFEQIIKIL